MYIILSLAPFLGTFGWYGLAMTTSECDHGSIQYVYVCIHTGCKCPQNPDLWLESYDRISHHAYVKCSDLICTGENCGYPRLIILINHHKPTPRNTLINMIEHHEVTIAAKLWFLNSRMTYHFLDSTFFFFNRGLLQLTLLRKKYTINSSKMHGSLH